MLNTHPQQRNYAAVEIGNDFFFASPNFSIAARTLRPLEISPYASMIETVHIVRDAIAAGRKDISTNRGIVGALPFSGNAEKFLFVSDAMEIQPSANREGRRGAIAPPRRSPLAMRETPSPHLYEKSVQDALLRLDRGEVEKIVLARALELELPDPVDVDELLQILLDRNPTGFTFRVPLGLPHAPHFFIGASPELLVKRCNNLVTANPLAGSASRGENPAQDQANMEALLQSEKDLREHAVVVEAVRRALIPYCVELDVPSSPTAIATPTMWHLSTAISGRLSDTSVTSLELALALHPTPAVCGTPTAEARSAIAEIEPFERGLYAGLVGWMSDNGDGEWAVAIRCAEIRERWLRLFAGAGIVRGSRPSSELSETAAKLRTMLSALGIDELPVS